MARWLGKRTRTQKISARCAQSVVRPSKCKSVHRLETRKAPDKGDEVREEEKRTVRTPPVLMCLW